MSLFLVEVSVNGDVSTRTKLYGKVYHSAFHAVFNIVVCCLGHLNSDSC